MSQSSHRLLIDLPAFDEKTGALHVVIETPKGNSNKFDYDPDWNGFKLAKTLPSGMIFPFDFGFIPSTLGGDGDPLDVLALLDFPTMPGCLVKARLIGAICAVQGKKEVRNDRLIAVAESARSHAAAHSLDDLRPHLLSEITDFFCNYNKEEDREFKPISNCDADQAMKLVEDGMKAFKKRNK
jgi:inorganic pyrophosphatase